MKFLAKRAKHLIVILVLLSSVNSFAQTFEEFKKQRNSDFQQYKENETRKMRQLQTEYDEYVKKRDQEFVDYLKQEWEKFNVFRGIIPPSEPKPDIVPEYKPPQIIRETFAKVPIISPNEVSGPAPVEIRAIPMVQISEPDHFFRSDLKLTFFGLPVYLDYDQQLKSNYPAKISESAIGSWWQKASKANYTMLVNQLLDYKNKMGLNDWGYFLLVKQTAESMTENKSNAGNLLSWFLLTRSGYRAKISYANDKTTLIIPSNQLMYGKDYLTISGINYYLMEPLGSNVIQTYARDYHDATRFFDFNLPRALNLGNAEVNKSIGFNYEGKDYKIPLTYNQRVMDFYRDYPQVNIDVYFDAAVSREATETLLNGLAPLLKGMDENASVNFLLHFVQTAFQYKTDQEQFGKEKFFFPEETLYYPYSDCEDRAVLFSFLVRNLLNLKVIGLEYPGHMATGVNFTDSKVAGSYVEFRNNRFIVADPTYINAPAGLCMPDFANSPAEIIELATVNYSANPKIDFWSLANKSGGYRGNNLHDLLSDEYGNVYLTGYFNDQARFGDVLLEGDKSSRRLFVASYDKYGKPRWATAPAGANTSSGFAITRDKEQNLWISGSFEGQMHMDWYSLKSKNGDVFIAKYDPAGKLVWAGQVGLDTIDHKSFLKYVARYDRSGKHLETNLYLEKIEQSENGIYTDADGNCFVAGTFQGTTGFNKEEAAYGQNDMMDLPKILKQESDLLIAQKVERNIAAVIAFAKVVKISGMTVPGNVVQQALDTYQPTFKKESPELYEKLGLIKMIRSNDGIVTILTNEGDPVLIDKLKIYNNAKVKITPMQDGNEKMVVLSGIKVGKFFIWLNLNYVNMLRDTGDMLFDYDSKHMQITMNLKNDIINN